MDSRPIGVFDSGLGGLTCVTHMLKCLPDENIIYFGDTARTPYGSKAVSTVRTFSKQIADFLVGRDVKMIVIACNTVSSTCAEMLRERYPGIPVVGIIEPAAEKVARVCSSQNRIGIIGTKVTINSGIYSKMILEKREDFSVYETACPALVPLIEEGMADSDMMELTLRYYLDDFILENRIDTIVLGCTHYPLIRDMLTRMYPDIAIINPSEEIVRSVARILKENDMSSPGKTAEDRFFASDLSENFVAMIDAICSVDSADIRFKNLEIDRK